jgi:hypothetical protein
MSPLSEILDEPEVGPWVEIQEVRNVFRETKRVLVTIEQGDFVKFEFENLHVGAMDDNSSEYTVRLSTPGGQPMRVNGEEVQKIDLTIIGDWEMNELVRAMREFVALADERPELVGPKPRSRTAIAHGQGNR